MDPHSQVGLTLDCLPQKREEIQHVWLEAHLVGDYNVNPMLW